MKRSFTSGKQISGCMSREAITRHLVESIRVLLTDDLHLMWESAMRFCIEATKNPESAANEQWGQAGQRRASECDHIISLTIPSSCRYICVPPFYIRSVFSSPKYKEILEYPIGQCQKQHMLDY